MKQKIYTAPDGKKYIKLDDCMIYLMVTTAEDKITNEILFITTRGPRHQVDCFDCEHYRWCSEYVNKNSPAVLAHPEMIESGEYTDSFDESDYNPYESIQYELD